MFRDLQVSDPDPDQFFKIIWIWFRWKIFNREVSGSGFSLEKIMYLGPICPERLDPDPVCHKRLDLDFVNIRPDLKHW